MVPTRSLISKIYKTFFSKITQLS